MENYESYIQRFATLLKEGRSLPLGGAKPLPRPDLPENAPRILIFSPHPDDEVIIGALPLRLMREHQMRVINVAVTLGSNPGRREGRRQELAACCDYIGFGLEHIGESGLSHINPAHRSAEPEAWRASVAPIRALLETHRPSVIVFPHDDDWNSTHLGVHHLVMDALATLPETFGTAILETEFWGAMDTPNLMVESSVKDIADLVTALTFHRGEVERNPYHLRLPAQLIDNVRRGGELVGGQGGAVPNFTFATLYRLRRWRRAKLEDTLEGGTFVGTGPIPQSILQVLTAGLAG